MFLSRQTTDKKIDMGLCYSILQKCIRRGLINEAMYYGRLVFHDGSPNALRKRLIQFCLEDMSRLDLALEILDTDDRKLFDYLQIICINKKSRISCWFLAVSYDHFKYKNNFINDEIEDAKKYITLEKKSKFKEIRDLLGKDISKLYSYMKKDNLVWSMKILWESRKELKYDLNINVDPKVKAIKFEEIPNYVLDKHVLNGTPGLKFFYENGAIIFNKIYDDEPYEYEAKNISYHNEKSIKDDRSIPNELYQNNFRNIKRLGNKSYIVNKFTDNKTYFIKEIDNSIKEKILFTENLKKIINFPNLNLNLIEINSKNKLNKIVTNLWLISDVVFSDFKFSDFFGDERNMMYDQKKLILATLFKSLVGSKNFGKENYLFDWKSKSPIYSVNDESYICDYKKRTYNIHIIPMVCTDDIQLSWEQYFKTFRKNDIINVLNKWKSRIKNEKELEYSEILLKRIKKIKKEIDLI